MIPNSRNIVLVGFMGTGKTTVGHELAKQTGMQLVDMDTIIADEAGKSVSNIFAEDGEAVFRQKEHDLVKRLADKSGLIISTGGGIVLNPENISIFEATSLVVCLAASTDEILKRLADDTTRPLLQCDDKRGKIETILKSRQHLYDAIPFQIQTDAMSIAAIVDTILKAQREA